MAGRTHTHTLTEAERRPRSALEAVETRGRASAALVSLPSRAVECGSTPASYENDHATLRRVAALERPPHQSNAPSTIAALQLSNQAEASDLPKQIAVVLPPAEPPASARMYSVVNPWLAIVRASWMTSGRRQCDQLLASFAKAETEDVTSCTDDIMTSQHGTIHICIRTARHAWHPVHVLMYPQCSKVYTRDCNRFGYTDADESRASGKFIRSCKLMFTRLPRSW